MANSTGSTLTHLECTYCGRTYGADAPHRLCTACEKVLYPRYDLAKVTIEPGDLRTREPNMWRYREVLPVRELEQSGTPVSSEPRLSGNRCPIYPRERKLRSTFVG